ncbi:MAG: RNA polymerase sigma-70 factor [Odoribacter splanchnicus]
MQVKNVIGGSSFEDLYRNYFQGLYYFAYHYIMSEEARDIVQEVFISVYENKDKLPHDMNIVGYLLSATRNRCMNFLRRQDIIDRHENRLAEAMISWEMDSQEEHTELTQELQRCMSMLSEQQRQVILLKTEGKSYAEIAQTLNITVGTVTTHLTRAYKVLRDNFGGPLLIIYFISRYL